MGRQLTQVAPGVWTATAEIWTSLTTLVVADDGACLIVDPGITVAEVESLAAEIHARGWRVEAAFATHPHWDHVLWSAQLGDVPRFATPAAVTAQARSRDADLSKADATAPGHDRDLFGRLTALPDDAVAVPWSGPRALVVDHRAHAPGHAALVLPDSGVLVAGDMLSDVEIPLLDVDAADPAGDYRDGLHRLEAAVTRHALTTVIPGHGHVGGPRELARRFVVDRVYLGALRAGLDAADPRLADPWLGEAHEQQLRAVSPD
ncbi:MAG TPA: MBL fold metallo-hydrolase [Cellulomonas sp.]|uniref:MBL fold metallo-hydrolase n=1 Tax=Cellulomonas sp. TaxID=40001 RepID=UPI002E30D9B7|nr:MBL fold metallo-hydrolase [Cellulomonas sp.]HEX5334116.1 MBL fold metallo-hydrolase [Cellulomonas sp.]